MSSPTNSSPTRPTPSSPSVSATAGFLNEKLRNAREALVSSDKAIYLGVPDKLRDLRWVRVGNADLLVTEESAAEYLEAQQALQADPEAPAPGAPKSAVLSAVVHIPAEDYWLTSDGMWKGPTDAAKTFADVKPSCTGQAPTNEVFSGDFTNVLKHMRTILDLARTKGFQQSKGVLVNGLGGIPKIKFRHILFNLIPDENGADNSSTGTLSDSESENIPPQYTMAGWHVQSDAAREALAEMQHTHSVNYLEAFDMHGKLLWPCHYRKYLQEALVQVHFTLKHWSIGGKNKTPCDTYAADIFSMRVLVPPPTSGPVTPKKRKFLQEDPLTPDISPKKFKAFAAST